MSGNRFEEAISWRHHIHRHPELGFEVHSTADFIADRLHDFGCTEIIRGIGGTGVVGIIEGRKTEGRTVGLRAELDALPIKEETDVTWRSTTDGAMHACGHDGHMAMLLGAGQALAAHRDFNGRVALIFQPAEEKGGGGREMVKAGLMDRCSIDVVYGMHNLPGLPIGHFATRPGALMAETVEFDVVVRGKGGHAAHPSTAIDPVVIAAETTMALQTIASRSIDPLEGLVVSVTCVHGGTAYNVIPQQVTLSGTIRSLRRADTDMAVSRLRSICEGCAAMHGGLAEITLHEGYPITSNATEQTAIACSVAARCIGLDKVRSDVRPLLGSEDFSYMLAARPGAMMLIGNGDSAGLHHPAYDFNDAVIPYGIDYWLDLVATELPFTA